MTDLLIRVRENNRRIVRGVTHDDTFAGYRVQIAEGETIKVVLNLTDWLGSATVSSYSGSADGGTVSTAHSSGVFTLTASAVSGTADYDLTITTSDGRVRVERFRFEEPLSGRRDDYGSLT